MQSSIVTNKKQLRNHWLPPEMMFIFKNASLYHVEDLSLITARTVTAVITQCRTRGVTYNSKLPRCDVSAINLVKDNLSSSINEYKLKSAA